MSYKDLNIVTIDFETFYSTKYTLKRMSTSLYIFNDQFLVHGVGIHTNGITKYYNSPSTIEAAFNSIDWSKTALLAHHCVTPDTEVLTPNGWVKITKDIDKLAQWNPIDESIEFITPLNKIETTTTELYTWDSSYHQGSYTPHHRMFYQTTNTQNKWSVNTVQKVSKLHANNVYLPKSGILNGDDNWNKYEAYLLEAVRADGSWNGNQIRFKFKKQRKIQRLLHLLSSLNLKYINKTDKYNCTIITIKPHDLVLRIKQFLGKNKAYTQKKVLTLSLKTKIYILKESRYWDGHKENKGKAIYVSNKHLNTIEAFQTMAHTSGYSCNIIEQKNQQGFSAHIPNYKLYVASIRKTNRCKLQYKPTKTKYSGKVYCYTVPTGAFLIRRNGVVNVTGNCHFDGLILKYHYKHKPAYYLDTLSMARPVLANKIKSLGIDSISKYYGLKGKLEGLEDTKDKRELTTSESTRLGEYCIQDVDLTLAVFYKLLPHITPLEMEVINCTVKMYADPKIRVDEQLIDKEIVDITTKKKEMFNSVQKIFPDEFKDMDVVKVLRSGDMLAKTLHHNGVISPTKTSLTTGKETHAFAKTDLNFQELENSPIPEARLLYNARLLSKSDTALNKALILKQFAIHKACPVYLNYWRAQTGRFSGCVTPDHELLTPTGWIKIKNWNGEQIEEWNPINNSLTFNTPTNMNVFEVDELLNEHDSRYLKMVVTDEHKIPINNKWYDKVSPYKAKDLYSKNAETFVASKHRGTLIINEYKLKLIIAFQADGSFNNRKLVSKKSHVNGVTFEFNKKRKIDRLETILQALNITYNKKITKRNTTRFYFSINQANYLTKKLSWNLINLKTKYRQIVLDEVLLWDGHTSSNRWQYLTTSKNNAEIIATLVHLNSSRAFFSKPKKQLPHYKQQYKVSFTPNQTAGYIKKANWSKKHYKGNVYCPTTSTGYFLVRYKNCVFITGNSDKIQMQNLPRGGAARRSLLAPEGHVILVSDLSQIELRMSAWFSDQQDVLDIFAKGQDVYKHMAMKIYNVAYDDVTKDQRSVGKVACLGLGYGCGINTFDKMLKAGAMGPKVDLPISEVSRIVNIYRASNDKIVKGWKKAGEWLWAMCDNHGEKVDDHKGMRFELGRARMPNGMYLEYPNMHLHENNDITFMGSNGIQRRIYSSLFFENCIAENTLILTKNGWKQIQNVLNTDLIHDGIEFVTHSGLLYKGKEQCILIDNVYMTPDHEVLDELQNWTAASQLQGLYRPKIRNIDRYKILGSHKGQKTKNSMGVQVRLRKDSNKINNIRSEEGYKDAKLWMPKISRKSNITWDELSSGIRSLEQYGKTLQTTLASSLEKLRRSWNNGMQRMERKFQSLLEGHGCNLQTETGVRSERQQWKLQQEKLPLGILIRKPQQSAKYDKNTNTKWNNEPTTNIGNIRYKENNTTLSYTKSTKKRMVKTSKNVYDIKNCGPRHRFVVLGKDGPFIVHNCIQALARNVIAEQLVKVSKRYDVVMSVHDELIMSVPLAEIKEATEYVEKCMRTSPSWCSDLLLDCESGYAACYSK